MKLIFNASSNFKFNSEISALEKLLGCKSVNNLKSVLKSNFNVLVIYNSGPKSILAVILGKLKGRKVYYCFHEPFYSFNELLQWKWEAPKYLAVNIIHFFAAQIIDRGIVFSNFGIYKLKKISRKNLEIKKSGLALDNIVEIHKKLSINIEPIKISFLGSINRYKNPLNFISKYESKFPELNIEYTIYSKDFEVGSFRNIKVVRDHLSDEKFKSVILDSSLIHIPHNHCTQSGILSQALSLGRPVLINNTYNYRLEPKIDGYCGIIDDSNVINKLKSYNVSEMSLNAKNYYLDNLKLNKYAFE
jgi:hypothetical protein